MLFAPDVETRVAESGRKRFEITREDAILCERPNKLADRGNRFADTSCRLEGEAIFEPLSGTEQFDSEQALGVFDDLAEFEGRGHAHRNVIFFAAGCRNAVGAGRMGENLGLVEQSR